MASIIDELSELARLPDADLPLERMAALVSADHQAKTTADDVSQAFNRLAASFEDHFSVRADPFRLTRFIHDLEGFKGNTENYYAPENSYIDRVLATRRGIPISLALVHLCLAERLGLRAWGINFPGHVLVGYDALDAAVIDPFSGRQLSHADCQTLLKQNLGPRHQLTEQHLEAASPRALLLRLIENLKQYFWRKRDWNAVERSLRLQRTLTPSAPQWSLQTASVKEMRGDLEAAQRIYRSIIETTSDQDLKTAAMKRLTAMGASKSTLH